MLVTSSPSFREPPSSCRSRYRRPRAEPPEGGSRQGQVTGRREGDRHQVREVGDTT